MTKRSLLLLLAILLLQGPQAGAAGLMEWVCKKLKKDCTALTKVGAVRGGSPRVGTRLALYQVQKDAEVTLWDCKACWSPAVLSSTEVAVLGTEGLWRVSLSPSAKPPVLAIKAKNVVRILGLAKEPAAGLLVLLDGGPKCCPQVGLADLDQGTISAPADQPKDCRPIDAACDLYGPRVDQLQGDLLLSATDSDTGDPAVLTIRDVARKGLSSPLQKGAQWDDGLSRFDPIWVGKDQVVYVTSR